MTDKFDIVPWVACLDTINANCVPVRRVTRSAAIKIVHWEWRVGRDLVEALPAIDRLLYRILVTEDFVSCNKKYLFCHGTRLLVSQFTTSPIPLQVGVTPEARHRPPKRLLNIWLSSNVAVALLVISIPAASPSKIRFLLRMGWDWVEIRTPAWALRKMSFSSKMPLPPLKMQMPPSRPSNILFLCYRNKRNKKINTDQNDQSKLCDKNANTYLKCWIRISFDPNTRHSIVKYFVLL